jgi:tripartite-type tricarboxylate transporter receptor subunit TctC
MRPAIRASRRALLTAAATLAAAPALGQGFPTRPIRIVSPFTPGGGTDTTARLLAPGMGEFLGQPVVVENRPGGAGSIGAASVAEAPADGHTLMVDALNHVVNPHLLRGLRFDYAQAFVPVSLLTVLPQIMVVPPALPVTTLAEFIAWARARPGRLSYGSSGNATGAHLAGTLFLRETGLDITHVPYRGGSAVLPDIIAGNVVFAFATVNSATQLIQDGRLRALAIASDSRVPSLPAVPTMAEAGLPAVVLDEWNGLYAPAGTPPEVLARIHAALRHALALPAVRDRFAAIGAIPVGSPPEAAARYVAERREAMGRLVRDAGITIE